MKYMRKSDKYINDAFHQKCVHVVLRVSFIGTAILGTFSKPMHYEKRNRGDAFVGGLKLLVELQLNSKKGP